MNYKYEVQLSATPEAVFKALTTSEGIAAWWAKSNTVWEENVDEFLSVDFGQVKKLMRVQKANHLSGLTWHVLECTLREWPGTRITFNVTPTLSGGSLLKLEHIGLNPQLECFESCSSGWEYFMASLKQYVETGKGTPH